MEFGEDDGTSILDIKEKLISKYDLKLSPWGYKPEFLNIYFRFNNLEEELTITITEQHNFKKGNVKELEQYFLQINENFDFNLNYWAANAN